MPRAARWMAAAALLAWMPAAAEPKPAPETTVSTTKAPSVSEHAEPARVTVGDPVKVSVRLEAPAGSEPDLPDLSGRLGPFRVLDGAWSGPEVQAGIARWTWSGTLAAYETGSLAVPAVEIQVRGPDHELRTARGEAVEVEVRSVLPPDAKEEDLDLADLKPPAEVPPDYRPLYTALAVLGALAVLAALAWWLQRRLAPRLRRVPVPVDPFRRRPPHEWFYGELQRLLEQRLAERGEGERFFEELARILKTYLGGRYRVDLLERTTEEVAPVLEQAGAPRDAVREAREILRKADAVKFARIPAGSSDCREGIESAYRVADRTRPAGAAAPGKAEATG